MEDRELIPLTEAARRHGVSRMTMARLVRRGLFTIYRNPLDQRQKLLDATEVAERLRPRPERPEEGKAAA